MVTRRAHRAHTANDVEDSIDKPLPHVPLAQNGKNTQHIA